MDDLLHCQDGDHVVDYMPVANTRPIPTPARSNTMPRVVSINDALTGGNGLELKIPLGLQEHELERLLDFDPVSERISTSLIWTTNCSSFSRLYLSVSQMRGILRNMTLYEYIQMVLFLKDQRRGALFLWLVAEVRTTLLVFDQAPSR